ncbi:translation elongation factor Ts [Caulobacter sp. B11]|uniref:translation elongation factor Ts n=1 Tax=Caulobacter sp. B11 TaxID=2048899 RepID=UPI003513526B
MSTYIHNATAPELGRIGVSGGHRRRRRPGQDPGTGPQDRHARAATAPLSLSPDDLDQAAIDKERAIFTEQALESGKPPAVVEKMVEGRIRKFLEEVVLLKQAFVMNPDQTVEQLVAETGKELGSTLTVKGFVRLALGEGVEKAPAGDFAAEVAAMTGGQA